jgi:hypothetical protein
MTAMTNFLENKLIDWFFRGQAIGVGGASAAAGSGPTTLYIGLFTTTPSDGSNGIEVNGGSYSRVAVNSSLTNWAGTQASASTSVSAGSNGTTSNNTSITFPAPTDNWGTITGFGIFDAVASGNLLIYGALTTNKIVNNGDAAPVFAVSALTVQIDN